MALAAINAITLELLFPLEEASPVLVLLAHAYGAGHVLALGLAAMVVVAAWVRWGPRRAGVREAGLAVVTVALTWRLASHDLIGLAESTMPIDAFEVWWTVIVAGAGLLIAAALFGARCLARRRASLAAAVGMVGLGLAIANQLVLENLYAGLHVLVAGAAATIMGVAFARAPLPARAAERIRGRVGLLLVVMGALAAGVTLILTPPSAVLLTLSRLPGSPLASFQSSWSASLEGWPGKKPSAATVPDAWGPWFADRSQLPDLPPGEIRLMNDDAVIILLVVDAMRADVLTEHADRLPHMTRLRDEGLHFSRAYAPSSATSQTMSAVFTGKYHTQLAWAGKRTGRRMRLSPHVDESVRVLELLSDAGVATLNAAPHPGLQPEYGITRGMSRWLEPKDRWAPAQVAATVAALSQLGREPAFIYLHFDEPHSPYSRAGEEGTPFERYLREVELVDAALAPLLDLLERNPVLAARTMMILTADHGEAFGEHRTRFHARTVYEEVVRVPLVFHAPSAIDAGEIDVPVSLIDLAPTFLDLHGEPIPGPFMGQSLVPILAGKPAELHRPIAFDTTGHAFGLLFPDGTKLIVDPRRGTRELYDLNVDPRELDDVFDARQDAPWRLEVLRRFWQVHRMQPPGHYAY